ncbi:MAG: hypothetical protein RLY35_939 [Bacteroidota bacterium]
MKKNVLVFMLLLSATIASLFTSAQSPCQQGWNYVQVNVQTAIFGNEMSWTIVDGNGQVYLQSAAYLNNAAYAAGVCVPDGCYTLHLHDSFGDGWNGGSISVTGDSTLFFSGTLTSGADLMTVFAINTVDCAAPVIDYGCMDPNAANFNPSADISDGSCLYGGCTDPTAINFNTNAGVLDSSCVYCNNGVNAHLYICTFGNGSEVGLSIIDSNGVVIFTNPTLGNVAIFNTDLCLNPNMCYTAVMTNNAGNLGWSNGYFWINVGGAQIIHESLDATLISEEGVFSVDGSCGDVIVYGCTDASATNYNSNAEVNDGSCVYPIFGCMQMNALNYNPAASYEDGSCITAGACGSMNMLFFDWTQGVFANECSVSIYDENGNYMAYSSGLADSYACVNDGCFYLSMNDNFGDGWENNALNIYLNAGDSAMASPYLSSGSAGEMMLSINTTGCALTIEGCMDVNAMNYNPAATSADSSCVYSQDCEYGWSYIATTTGNWADEMSYTIVNSNGDVVFNFEGQVNNSTSIAYACFSPDCYAVEMQDSWGDGWNGGYVSISNSLGYGAYYGGLNWGSEQVGMYGILSNCDSTIMGCMDSTALNYSADATEDDGSCMYNDNNPQGENPGMNLLEANVKLYPNPATTVLNINLEHFDSINLQYTIRSVDGKLLEQGRLNANQWNQSLDIQGLASGVYLLEIKNNEAILTQRFVKN